MFRFFTLLLPFLLVLDAFAQQPQPAPSPLLGAMGMAQDTVRPAPLTLPDSMQAITPQASTSQADTPQASTLATATTGGIDAQTAPAIGTLKGRLVTTQGSKNNPVPFASIGLFRTRDSSSVTGALTDEQGNFIINNLVPDVYYALVQSLGYAPKKVPRVVITTDRNTVDLGTVILAQTTRQLDEVVVQGEKQAYEYALDRKIVNVDQLPIAQGGSAIDILQNVPSVTIDVDGALSLRGSANVIVLVDGKPSGLTGLDRQAVLDQIPASNIERVEVITNPSSRYDADGAAGIINIVLKKERSKGFNGNVQVNVGTRDKYNASINGNLRLNKLNLFGSYNFRDERRFSYRNADRRNLFGNDSVSYLVQRQNAVRRSTNNNLRFGFDYGLTKKDNLTLSVLYRPQYSYDTEVETFDTQNGDRQSLGQTLRTNAETEPQRGLDYAANYRHTFEKEGRLLTADATTSSNTGTEYQDFLSTTNLPDSLLTPGFQIGRQRATNQQNNRVTVLQTDFINPMKGKQKFETGFKYTYRRLGADYQFANLIGGEYINNPLYTNNFIYTENTSAAYANFGNELKTFSYQVGLRSEYTTINTDQRTTGKQNAQSYIYLFPSAFLNYNLGESNKVQLNYSRRINRPSVRTLNPFIDLQDPLNIRFGNPLLSPELINSFEVSHLFTGKTTLITSTLFLRQTNNDITRYQTLRADGITEQTYLNLNRSENYGLEFVVDQEVTKWWRLNGTATFFQRTIKGNADTPSLLTRTNKSWNGRVTSNFTPKRGTAIQLAVNYRSPFIIAQGTIQQFFNVDIGVKHDVFKGRGTLNLRVSDIFNTLQFQANTFGDNFESTRLGKRESRIGFIGFSYRLSRQISSDKDRDEERQDDTPGEGDF